MLRLIATSFAATATLLAQGGAPTFVPRSWLGRIAVEDVPKLLEQVPGSAIGKLLADEEVAGAFAAGLARYRKQADRTASLYQALHDLQIELDPWYLERLATDAAMAALRSIDLADLQRLEFGGVPRDGDDAQRLGPEAALAIVHCRPRAEGRCTAVFDRLAKTITAGGFWKCDPDGKFEGFATMLFEPTGKARSEHVDPDMVAMYGGQRLWMLHLPGTFAFGSSAPAECGALAPPPERPPAQIVGETDIGGYVRVMETMGGGTPPEFQAIGADSLRMLRWRWQFAGPHMLDEIEIEVADDPTGLVKALLLGNAALPAQPLPEPALAQVRAGVDVAALCEHVGALVGGGLPPPLATAVTKALTGGIALGASAPAVGSMLPRLYLSLGIADDKALDELFAMLPETGLTTKEATYENTPCTVLTIAGAPSGLQPTWCRIGGTLHVAESAASMRAFLKARAAGGDAMAVGDLAVPAGAGEVLPTFDVRCDQAALYRAFHTTWLPLLKLIPFGGARPLLAVDEMPSPDAVTPLLGKSRGVLRRDGNTFRIQQVGPLGGLLTCGLAMTWGPLLSGPFHANHLEDTLARQIADKKLDVVHDAIEAFAKRNQRRPADLGELFAADPKLPVDALLMPGTDEADTEAVAMPAGDPRAIRSAFRYFKDGVKVDADGEAKAMLLIEIRARPYARAMLAEDGSRPQVWGEDSRKPIDQFGK